MKPSFESLALDDADRRVVEALWGGLPLVPRPYAAVAGRLGLGEDDVVARLRRLIEDGATTAVAPRFDPEKIGGTTCAAAMDVPFDRVATVAAGLGRLAEVADLRRRDHRLNLWFAIVTEHPHGVGATQRAIEAATRLEVLLFPKVRDYPAADVGDGGRGEAPDAVDRALTAAMRDGLSLDPDPWGALASAAGIPAAEVLVRLARMIADGRVLRFGAEPRDGRFATADEGLTVWDVDDREVDDLGARVAALPFVTRCHRRPRALPVWPYNLFVSVRGGSRREVAAARAAIAAVLDTALYASDVLVAKPIGTPADPRRGKPAEGRDDARLELAGS